MASRVELDGDLHVGDLPDGAAAVDPQRPDTGSMPLTEPHVAPIFDTGPHPAPLDALGADSADADPAAAQAYADLPSTPHPAQPRVVPPAADVATLPAHEVSVRRFLAVLAGVWVLAVAGGGGLYYWWFHATAKTWPDLAVLVYVAAAMVSALIMAMPERRPTLSATAIAVMTAPFASALGAGAMYASYVWGWLAL